MNNDPKEDKLEYDLHMQQMELGEFECLHEHAEAEENSEGDIWIHCFACGDNWLDESPHE